MPGSCGALPRYTLQISRESRAPHRAAEGGCWALPFGWKEDRARIERKDLHCIVPAPAIIAGRGNGEIAKRTIRLDSAGVVPAAAYGERSATSSPGESHEDDSGVPPKNVAEAKQRSTSILGLDLKSGLGLKGASEQIEELRVRISQERTEVGRARHGKPAPKHG